VNKAGPIVSWSLLLLLPLFAVVLRQCDVVNNQVDLCDDPTSGKYIWNDEQRARTCNGPPVLAASPVVDGDH
jgi:hypothetical protein